MNEHKIVVNNEGYMTEGVVLLKDGILQDYTLKEDEILVPMINTKQDVNSFVGVTLLKPQWTGSEWIETATQEELNEAYPPIEVQKTDIEILKETVDALVLANLGV